MSDEKYIINKDSLTGIADAVRDKLGVGKATTDPQTGDIVYPEGKGYYIENEDVEEEAHLVALRGLKNKLLIFLLVYIVKK